MKIFNCNWESILNLIVLWNDVPEESRAYYLYNITLPVTLVKNTDSALTQPLVNGGFLTLSPSGVKYELTRDARLFHKLIMNLERHDIFDKDNYSLDGHIKYLKSYYTNEERMSLTENCRDFRKDDEDLVLQIGCARWLSRFLFEHNIRDRYSLQNNKEQLLSASEPMSVDHIHLAQKIVQELIDGNNPVPLTNIFDLNNSRDISKAAKTIVFLLENILTYLSIDQNTYGLVMGIHPLIHSFINAKKVQLIKSEVPVTECPPFLIDDLTTLLVSMSLKPIPVTQKDFQLYIKSVNEISSRFYKLPEIINSMHTYTNEERMRIAVSTAKRLKLAELETSKKKTYLVTTDKSKSWLKLPIQTKLKKAMRAPRDQYLARKEENLTRNGVNENLDWFDVIETIWENYSSKNEISDMKGSVFNAFKALAAAQGPVSERSFITDQVYVNNPYLTLFHSQILFRIPRGWFNNYCIDYNYMITTWHKDLQDFIVKIAIPYGLMDMGEIKNTDSFAISVNDIGRYFLGERDTLPQTKTQVEDSILIQPNFEIVFMGSDPAAEVQIGQFCDRLGSGIGTLFKISRASIIKCASIGLDAEYILKTLEKLSPKPVPSNVKEQIKNWSAQCRKIRIENRILFICPDKETALKVKSSGGDKVEQISDTIISISDRKFANTLAKKLEGKGIFRESE